MRKLCLVALCLTVAACSSAATSSNQIHQSVATSGAFLDRAFAEVESHRQELIDFRRDLHRNPELSGEEARTSALVADRLEQLGFQVRRDVGGYGVVAVLVGGQPGPVVAFRADMDASAANAPDPIAEIASLRSGVRHICGHDIHTTIGIALAEAFAPLKEELAGTIVLVFQPAEETLRGARHMIEQGALTAPKPDAIFAYHTAPYEVGVIAYAESALMSARDQVTATVSPGPRAQEAAAALRSQLAALSNVASLGELQPLDSDFAWIGGQNPVQDENVGWRVVSNVSLITEAARARVRGEVVRVVEETEAAHPGVQIRYSYAPRVAPGTVNNPELTRRAVDSLRAEIGDVAVSQVRRTSPGFTEDFGHMQAEVPGAMFFLGVSNQSRGWVGLPHSPNYAADEESIFIGARAMIRVMLDYLAGGET